VDAIRLRLSMMALCRLGHPAISIPWSDIRVEMGRAWFMEVGTFRFARGRTSPFGYAASSSIGWRKPVAGSCRNEFVNRGGVIEVGRDSDARSTGSRSLNLAFLMFYRHRCEVCVSPSVEMRGPSLN
jgi:hypothetical protein